MATLKTKPGNKDIPSFLDQVTDDQKRKDCYEILDLMQETTKAPPVMWGDSIVGFGQYHYKYESGREGDWFLTGFSPRKQNLTLYIMTGFKSYSSLMEKLGKFKTGSCCLYIKRLTDVDKSVLKQLIAESVKHVRKKYQ